ncbi:PAS domain S-box protein [Polaribacter sp. Z022]|uniref:PAS domain S-box protein n=1 Tax=Polaribacter sp. Z022 TaxID=2927125 RepID=UPI00201FBBC0|nr:PAS domain S-box protein [Polaribacter sp. Z022]MCL7754933.1 PAS domain S-box protein [Polaribacter sp. Z022]
MKKYNFINIKILLLILIPTIIISYVGLNHYYNTIVKNEIEIIKSGVKNDLNAKSILVNDIYKSLAKDINIIDWAFHKEENSNNIKDFFVLLSNLHANYDQVRYIDTLGQEAIRVDFDSTNTAIVKEYDKLQDKSNRYYFKNAKKLKKGEIYFSNIDLNMEHGKIEVPHNPVLRVASKIYDTKNNWTGVIVINYYMNNLFNKLKQNSSHNFADFELYNSKGFALVSKNTSKSFSHILLKSDSLALHKTEKQLWQHLKQNNQGTVNQNEAIYIYKNLTINAKSTSDVHFKDSINLILVQKIDLNKVNKSQFIYVLYKWGVLVLITVFTLFIILNIQYYNYKIHYKNKTLKRKNNQLEGLKDKLQETLHIKINELKLTEKKFYSIFNNTGIGITLIDINGKPEFSNKKFIELLGYSEEELSTMTFADFTYPEDVNDDVKRFKRLIKREISSFSEEKRYICKDGSVIWGAINVSLLLDKENNIVNVIAAITNITDRKEAQKETKNLKKIINRLSYIAKVLNIDAVENISDKSESMNLVKYIEKQSTEILNANKAREELLKNLEYKNTELNNYAHIVSHDLRTPLQSISTLFSWIEMEPENTLTEESTSFVQLIHDNLEKMESLIKGILSYSNLDQNEMEEYPINTFDMVTDMVKLMPIPNTITINISKNLPIITGNNSRISQVFQNLINNAIQSIVTETGVVEIDAIEKEKYFEFWVKDNGKGIDKKYFKKIFELFQSIDDSETKVGMGLSLVEKVVKFYDGKIWVESELGKGSTFYFAFPKSKKSNLN